MSTTKRGQRRPYSCWIETRRDKGRKSYQIRWVDPVTGERKHELCGPDKGYARDRRDAKVTELRTGLSGTASQYRASDLLAKIDTWQAGKAANTRYSTRKALERLIEYCGDCRLRLITRDRLMEYRARLIEAKHSPANVNKHMAHVSMILSLAVDAGWMPANPCWHWRGMKLEVPAKRIRVLEPAEFSALIDKCQDPRLKVLLAVAYYQGTRRGNLCFLRWESVDFGRRVLYMESNAKAGELTKKRDVAAVPLRPVVAEVLSTWFDVVPKRVTSTGTRPKSAYVFSWEDGRPLDASWLSHAFRNLVKAAGIRHCTLHDLRRSFSTLAQRKGLAASTVQVLGGWKSLSVVKRHYTGEVDEAYRQAMNSLDVVPQGPVEGQANNASQANAG